MSDQAWQDELAWRRQQSEGRAIAGIIPALMVELPAVGATTPAARTVNSDHATTVTIAEAAARTGLSAQTWRRRLKAGQVSGAYKTAGAQGETWQIPVAALDTIAAIKVIKAVSDAVSETISDLQTKLATAESALALQRALADERLKALDQLHATMRALGAGTLPPEIRKFFRELPVSGETTPVARTPNSDHATDGDSDGIVCE